MVARLLEENSYDILLTQIQLQEYFFQPSYRKIASSTDLHAYSEPWQTSDLEKNVLS